MRGVALGLMLASMTAVADPPAMVFYWIDGRGNLYATDRLHDVPEPYYGLYQAKLKELAARRAAPAGTSTPVVAPPTASTPAPAQPPVAREESQRPSVVDETIARRRYYRETVATWRQRLEAATARVRGIDDQLAELESNAILALTPQVAQRRQSLIEERQQAMADLEAARLMLLETIPQQARREHVPPGWLQ